jgi:hypothetical protein
MQYFLPLWNEQRWTNSHLAEHTKALDGPRVRLLNNRGGVSATLLYMIRHYAEELARPNRPAGSSIWRLQFDVGAHYGAANT